MVTGERRTERDGEKTPKYFSIFFSVRQCDCENAMANVSLVRCDTISVGLWRIIYLSDDIKQRYQERNGEERRDEARR